MCGGAALAIPLVELSRHALVSLDVCACAGRVIQLVFLLPALTGRQVARSRKAVPLMAKTGHHLLAHLAPRHSGNVREARARTHTHTYSLPRSLKCANLRPTCVVCRSAASPSTRAHKE